MPTHCAYNVKYTKTNKDKKLTEIHNKMRQIIRHTIKIYT